MPSDAVDDLGGLPAVRTTRARRVGEAVAFVGLWMALGYALHTDSTAYLLLGVPLTVAFQRLVRRQPLAALWVRGPRAAPGRSWWGLVVVLVIVPGIDLVQALNHFKALSVAWQLCDVIGAFGAAYALVRFTPSTWKDLRNCLAVVGTLATCQLVAKALARKYLHHEAPAFDLLRATTSLLAYFPVGFTLEEVTFRGLLDSHVQEPGDRRPLASAFLVSALWGLWHLPVVPVSSGRLWAMVVGLLVTHSLIGVPLSLFWRRSGNLAVPGFAHAFADAVRNGFGFGA